jgi:hypothetical protein
MTRNILICAAVSWALAACGLGETAATSAVAGASSVEQAQQAKETQERVKAQIEAAQTEARRRLDEAEAAAN